MVKIAAGILIIFCCVLFLVACSNQSGGYLENIDYNYLEFEQLPELNLNAENIESIDPFTQCYDVLEEEKMETEHCGEYAGVDWTHCVFDASAIEPWQGAYAELLRHYAGKVIGSWAQEIQAKLDIVQLGGLFTLHDMDGNGMPELIIWSFSQGGYFDVYSAYTFADDEIIQLELRDRFGGRGSSIFVPSNNRHGLITTPGGSGYDRHNFITMDRHSLSLEVSVLEIWTPWEYDFSIYYIRGASVSLIEFTDMHHIWICTDCCHNELNSRGFVLTSEEEFERVINDVFSNTYHSDGMWPHEINEANIKDVLLNFSTSYDSPMPIVQVAYATDELVSRFERIIDVDYEQRSSILIGYGYHVAIWSDSPMGEFELFHLILVEPYNARHFYLPGQVLHTFDVILPEDVFVINYYTSVGTMAHMGISFVDGNGRRRYFTLHQDFGMGGFLLHEFQNRTYDYVP